MTKDFDVFGKMEYKHGWTKFQDITFFKKPYKIRISAQAYSGKDITPEQQKSYSKFIKNENKYINIIVCKIKEYIDENIDEPVSDVSSLIEPKTLLFKDNGDVIMLFDCKWDIEHGFAVQIIPKIAMGVQDLFL